LLDSEGRFVGATYTTLLSPWLFAGTGKATPNTIGSQDSILLVAPRDTGAGEKFLPLQDAEREVEEIGSRFPNSTILEGHNANWTALERNMKGKRLLHYAGHSDERANGTALKLSEADDRSQPDRLSANEIRHLQFQGFKLVVLSACSTDLGEEQHWLDRESLAFAFAEEGVSRVVATRWRTDSEAASRMMSEFYTHLLKGESPEGALRSAAAALRVRTETSHPYYWASFEVFGS